MTETILGILKNKGALASLDTLRTLAE